MPQKTLYMENTQIAPDKTAREISDLLLTFKARQISMEYLPPNGKLIGLRFVLAIAEGELEFKLPVRIEPVYQVLMGRRKGLQNEADKRRVRLQAERVAWRQLFRWCQAQLALIDTGMVAPQEVFLPYALQPGAEQTMYESFEREWRKQLTAGGAK